MILRITLMLHYITGDYFQSEKCDDCKAKIGSIKHWVQCLLHQVKPPDWIFLRRGKPLMIIWLWVMITDRFNWSSFLTHCGPLDCHYSGFLLVLHFPCSQECDQWHCGTGTYTISHWQTETQATSIKIISRSFYIGGREQLGGRERGEIGINQCQRRQKYS